MTRLRTLLWTLGALLLVLPIAATAPAPAANPTASAGVAQGFAEQVMLGPLDMSAVHAGGRLKSYSSFAYERLSMVSGGRKLLGQRHDFTYLDMIFRPERYADADMIYVKNKPMRPAIAEALRAHGADTARLEVFLKKGLLAPWMIRTEGVQVLLRGWSRDVVKTAKFVNQISTAVHVSEPRVLAGDLRLVPPPGGAKDQPWIDVATLRTADPLVLAGGNTEKAKALELLASEWGAIESAWQRQDADAVNSAIERFCQIVHQLEPGLYPSTRRLKMESWYFHNGSMTWVWLVYLLCIIPLMMAVVYRWESARIMGVGLFGVAFALHTAALLVRWYVSERWPNSNMFEAVTTSVWLGGVVAIVTDVLARRTAMRSLFLLGSAVASMAAMMSAAFVPQLDSGIRNMMPVLHDIWLLIHTNVIIASYALIAMAAVTAGLYLCWRLVGGAPDYARAGGAAFLIESDSGAPAGATGSTARTRRVSPGEVFDGATMVLMEVSTIMLWAGLVMGAIWADHSWGRPWGWDPKEVFALNTFIVFLVLLHVRLKARDKGLWTAILALIGCAVMLFNWIVINFVITGLHSYA